jgi:hypothetical protein
MLSAMSIYGGRNHTGKAHVNGGFGLFSDVRVLGQRSFQNPPHTSKTPRMRIQELA